MEETEQQFVIIANLIESLEPIRQEAGTHNKLRVASEHVNELYNVPEKVKEVEVLIQKDDLKTAHRKLAELENSRNNFLLDLHEFGDVSQEDQNVLENYFKPISDLSYKLEKQVYSVTRGHIESTSVNIGFRNHPPSEGSRLLKPARLLKQGSGYSNQVVAKSRVWVYQK